MATIEQRLSSLEKATNTAPMLVMDVKGCPTSEQQAVIDRAARAGRKLIVFCEPGNTLWMPGAGGPPWCEQKEDDMP